MNDFEECYKCVKITNNDNGKSTTVMIVDKCAGCKVGKAIDLTPSAFQLLSPNHGLGVGVLNISWKTVPCHKSPKHPEGPASHGKHGHHGHHGHRGHHGHHGVGKGHGKHHHH